MLLSKTMIPVGTSALATCALGEGPPLVFLHANVADQRMWQHQLTSLSSSRRVIAFDRRGFGETHSSGDAYRQSDDLFAVLDHLGEDRPAILVGCSRGGGIAIDAALAMPDRIAGLVLVAPGVSGAPAASPIPLVKTLLNGTIAAKKAGDLDEVIRLQAALWLDGPLANEGRVSGHARDLFHAMNATVLTLPPHGREIEPDPAWEQLSDIAVPVRVLCGNLDLPHIQIRCQKLASELPTGEFEMMSDVAHLPSLEQPARFTQWLLQVLEDF